MFPDHSRPGAGRERRAAAPRSLPALALSLALGPLLAAWLAPSVLALPPDPSRTSVWITPAGSPAVSLFTIPDGTGHSFAQAVSCASPGSPVVTPIVINVQMLDINGAPPTPAVAASALWLVTASGGMAPCANGKMTTADGPTDALGRTTFTQPLHAGGASNFPGEPMLVLYLDPFGVTTVVSPILFVYVNSPDIDGNGVVNLSDVVPFSTDIKGGTYVYRSDFHFDLKLNLTDIILFATAIGKVCP